MVSWSYPLKATCVLVKSTVEFFMINIVFHLSPSKFARPMFERMFSDDDVEEKLGKPMFSFNLVYLWRMYKSILRANSINMFPMLAVGQEIPRDTIYCHYLDHDDKVDLTFYQQDNNIPLVLNFGSCT
jgi:hypothetical protein